MNTSPNIVLARKTRGLSQSQAAEKIGISTGYYQEVERGRKTPGAATIAKIKEVLGVDFGALPTAYEAKRHVRCVGGRRRIFKVGG